MSSPGIVGGAAGLLGAAVSVVSNLRRGDPHWVSTAPDVLTLGIVCGSGMVRSLAGRGSQPGASSACGSAHHCRGQHCFRRVHGGVHLVVSPKPGPHSCDGCRPDRVRYRLPGWIRCNEGSIDACGLTSA